MGRHTRQRSKLARFAPYAKSLLVFAIALGIGATLIQSEVRTTIPEGLDVAIYDDDLNIVDINKGSELYIWPWTTVEYFQEPYDEEPSGTYRIIGQYYDSYDRVYEPASNLFVTMTEQEAIQYLNGRPDEAKEAQIAMTGQGGKWWESLTAYAERLAAEELSLEVAASGSSLPMILWRQSGVTSTEVNKNAIQLYEKHKDDNTYVFFFECKKTTLSAINHDLAAEAYRDFFWKRGLTFDVGINDVTVMRERTEKPCVAVALEDLAPAEDSDDGSVKHASADTEPPTFFDLFDANREEPLLAWFYHSSKLVKNPALATQ